MNCPGCNKGIIKEQISTKGFLIKKKEVTYFCPLCEWENKKIFKISKEDVEMDKELRLADKEIEGIRAKNIKENKQIKDTKYNQTYKSERRS